MRQNGVVWGRKVRMAGVSLLMGIIGAMSLAVASAQSLTWLGTSGGLRGAAYGVSADGRVVVGRAENASRDSRAFRWENGAMQDLGTLLDSDSSVAYSVSADGRVVVGAVVKVLGDSRAFRWTQAGGMEDLNITYANLLTDGSVLAVAYALSPDGRYIVGWGRNARTGRTEGFLLDTCATHDGDVDNNGCIDDTDLLAVLFAFGGTSELGRADVNCDGQVDDADLLTVLFHFGAGC